MSAYELSFTLPDISQNDIKAIATQTRVLQKKRRSVGTASPLFEKSLERIRTIFKGVKKPDPRTLIQKPIDARVVANLLLNDAEFSQKVCIDSTLLSALSVNGKRVSRMALLSLIDLYLSRYTKLPHDCEVQSFTNFLMKELESYSRSERESELSHLAAYSEMIFSPNGHVKVVDWASVRGVKLQDALEQFGLSVYRDGDFSLQCRYRYYLETLRSIEVGSANPIFNEVVRQEVYMAPGLNGGVLGHEIVSILIDRSKQEKSLSEEWQAAILGIAGDPRVPKEARNYQHWWLKLGEERISLMRGWLSKLDLRLFLKVLQNYGRSSRDTELQRMFPARKRFLEGLLDQDLVGVTRLFVNPRAEQYLENTYKPEELPEYARVKDTYRSMIYLQVGNIHMIEGSHNCSLWLFPRLHNKSRILTYEVKDFTPKQLGKGLEEEFFGTFPASSSNPVSIRHSPDNFSWQHSAIFSMKQMGVKLDIEKLFNKTDYKKYKRMYGID